MPGQMRLTVFFQSGTYGWTETLFPGVADGDYAAAVGAGSAYCAMRQGLLAAGAGTAPVIVGFRVSDDTIFRDALVQLFQPPLAGTFSGVPETPFSACLVRLVAGPLWRRPLYLRGIPSTIVRDDGSYNPIPTWIGQINLLRNMLVGPPAYRVKTTVASPPSQIFRIQSLTPPNNVTTLLPTGFIPNQLIVVKGASRHRNPIGLHSVGPLIIGNSFTLNGVDLPADYVYFPILSLGVQAKNINYQPILAINDERITERKTGRPFGLPRGRRSPVRV
jgi:hypothetical protein